MQFTVLKNFLSKNLVTCKTALQKMDCETTPEKSMMIQNTIQRKLKFTVMQIEKALINDRISV